MLSDVSVSKFQTDLKVFISSNKNRDNSSMLRTNPMVHCFNASFDWYEGVFSMITFHQQQMNHSLNVLKKKSTMMSPQEALSM